ncbi:hypothetical protein MDOR_38460 [Mycolicibacterium doricum]|uniref:Uncharacterized protein n=2 Tax=Mycolicibacterium doricum TaxID=126673 RepID=A0A1X1SZB5_9MYCO|nr:hypothetical protein [Mycolicibacterium doricum]ORV37007.1 hypothetical protein AWC01_17055 [Mycolicibacterium doricum]BBZ09677.1 hypothetical protein MDOR_38460 [Mycolicibacterium doricum]
MPITAAYPEPTYTYPGADSAAATPYQDHLTGTKQNPVYVMPTKEEAFGGGAQLGQDIMSGMFEIAGIGDLFKDPTQFGLFKVFKGLMGLNIGDTGATRGGDGASLPGFMGGDGGGLSSILSMVPQAFGELNTGGRTNAPGQFMPALPSSGGGSGVLEGLAAVTSGQKGALGPGNQGPVDMSVAINGGNFGYSRTEVAGQVQNQQLRNVRAPLRSMPHR